MTANDSWFSHKKVTEMGEGEKQFFVPISNFSVSIHMFHVKFFSVREIQNTATGNLGISVRVDLSVEMTMSEVQVDQTFKNKLNNAINNEKAIPKISTGENKNLFKKELALFETSNHRTKNLDKLF